MGAAAQVFHGEGDDPDLSGALSTVLWEVSLLSKHYHPDVAKLATQISKMESDSKDFVLSALSPKDAVLQYATKDGGFRPTIQLPRKLTNKKAYPNNILLSKSMCAAGTIESGKNAEDIVSPDIFSSHFKVLRDFEKNKILRKELQQATRLIELYRKSKMKRKKRRKNKNQDSNCK
jgi:nucleolar complex protein 3